MRSRIRARLRRVFILALLTLCTHAAATQSILLVTDPGLPTDAAEALQALLEARQPALQLSLLSHEEIATRPPEQSPAIAVSFGASAALAVRHHLGDTPQLHLLLTREAYSSLPPAKSVDSAIFIDQSASRLIATLKRALPNWPLAIVASPSSAHLAAALEQAARAAGVAAEVLEISAPSDWHLALERLLQEPAVLVAVPDPTLYNSHTIRNILLASYRHRSPLAGFSPAYLRAGALVALYTTPEQLAEQATQTLELMLNNASAPPASYSSEVEVGINIHVARSLGISIPAPEAIARDVLTAEREMLP